MSLLLGLVPYDLPKPHFDAPLSNVVVYLDEEKTMETNIRRYDEQKLIKYINENSKNSNIR